MNEKDYDFVLSEVKLLREDDDSFSFEMPETARGKTGIFVEVFDGAYRIEANDIIEGAFVPIGGLGTRGAEFGDYSKFMNEFSLTYRELIRLN